MRSPSSDVVLSPRFLHVIALVAAATLIAGCASRRPAPVEDRAAVPPQPQAIAPEPIGPSPPVAVEIAPAATYTVKRGDTLHQIALDNGLDYRELAAWNNIENVNLIRVGQVLRLAAPGAAPPVAPVTPGAAPPVAQGIAPGVTTAPLRLPPAVVEVKPQAGSAIATAPPSSPPAGVTASLPPTAAMVKTSPKAIKEPYSDQVVRELTLAASAVPAPRETLAMAAPGGPRNEPSAEPSGSTPTPPKAATPPAPATAGDPDRLDWAWPAKGRIIAGFSDTANLKGIDIAGAAGDAVHASAPGRVVYAGTGLRGYGKLIIIKHNATYLSAYAHNREILVKEGQQVTRGQKIAEMGNTDADQVKLHFEIRRLGKPMDPTKYLPPA